MKKPQRIWPVEVLPIQVSEEAEGGLMRVFVFFVFVFVFGGPQEDTTQDQTSQVAAAREIEPFFTCKSASLLEGAK